MKLIGHLFRISLALALLLSLARAQDFIVVSSGNPITNGTMQFWFNGVSQPIYTNASAQFWFNGVAQQGPLQ